MRFKRLLALLLAAALALSLLAGCGGGKALSQVIVDLLDGLYSNVSVEADSDLTAALKQAAAEGGTEEEILSRMIEILNHKGGSITFTRLGSGQQGEHGVTLYFQPGTDPDAAARNALAQWAGTLGTLPDDGSYQADVAMIETENGYYIALDVEVLKAGKPDKPDKDDDEPETQEPPEPDKGYSYDETSGTYTVNETDGLQELFNDKKDDINKDTVIKLTTDQTITGTEPLANTFNGILQGEEGAKINLSGESRAQGLFNEIGASGQVLDVDIEVTGTINTIATIPAGAVAGKNNGEISGCDVTINGTSCDYSGSIGGVVGTNNKTISDCTVTIKGTGISSGGGTIGGVAGDNYGTIENCRVTGDTIQSSWSGYGSVGGIVGDNKGTIEGCSSAAAVNYGQQTGGIAGINTGGSITACYSTGAVSGSHAGGVVGYSYGGTVTACYHAIGTVQGDSKSGGVAGFSNDGVTACYWSVTSSKRGIGGGKQNTDSAYSEAYHQNMVGSDWAAAVTAMNNAIANWNNNHQNDGKLCNYQYQDGNSPEIIPGAPTSTTTP